MSSETVSGFPNDGWPTIFISYIFENVTYQHYAYNDNIFGLVIVTFVIYIGINWFFWKLLSQQQKYFSSSHGYF